MLRELGADDDRFRTLTFHAGLNVVVADVAPGSSATDSRNGAGKSSLIELLHFLLGERSDRSSLPLRPLLRSIEFSLLLDWPGEVEPVRVCRAGGRSGWVNLRPVPSDAVRGQLELASGQVPVGEWQRLIERDLFGMPDDHAGVSGRGLLSFLMRRTNSQGYASAVRSHGRQADSEAATDLAYLLGLDWHLADRYRLLKARAAAQTQMRKAAQDPILGRIIGKAADLRSEIALAQRRVEDLERQVSEFRVVPEYEHLRREADLLDQRIRELRSRDTVDRRNLEDLERALAEATEPDISYLEPVYQELGVMFTEQVRRRFEDVRAFHNSVVRNRRRYLEDEVAAVRTRLAESETQRGRLGEQLTSTLRTLDEGGALESLTTLQGVLGEQRALLAALRHRYEAAQALDTSKRDLAQARLAVQQEMTRDIEDRGEFLGEATVLFARFARRLYGADRTAYLRFEATDRSLRIQPHIASDSSAGIGSMVIFCFDLTMSVLAHRAGRAPDFLVHDSHLFDGVDDRQIAAALTLAAEVVDSEGIQYIVTLNSDDLDKAYRRGFDASAHVLSPRLTDQYENGGLFGFRF